MPRTKLQSPNFNLTKRDDGYYVIRYTDPETGKTRDKATGTKDPKEAEAQRTRFAQDYRKPKLAARPTVAELCDAYVTYRTPTVARPGQLPYCYAPLKRHLGALYADSITQTVVNDYVEDRLEEPVIRKGGRYGDQPVGEATVSKELRSLRAALNWAWSEHMIEREVTFRVELSAGASRARWITKEEANRLMLAAPPHLALFILIGLTSAKRREAILTLPWSSVDLSRPGHESLDFGDDVGNKRRGRTPIAGNVRLIEALKSAKERAKTSFVIEFRGEPIKDVKVALRAACERAGIEVISAHVLKHTAITWMVQAGMTFEEIAKFTSTSKDVVERVYGHHSPEFVAGAMRAVAF
jgi:integrase